jgi:hypothetical protein
VQPCNDGDDDDDYDDDDDDDEDEDEFFINVHHPFWRLSTRYKSIPSPRIINHSQLFF